MPSPADFHYCSAMVVRPPFGPVLALTLVAALAALRPANEDVLSRYWVAEAPHGDYIESVSFAEDGGAHLLWGYGQLTRCEWWPGWTRDGADMLRLEGWDDDAGWLVRNVHFKIDHGDYELIEHEDDTIRHYYCRITFEESPFPEHCDTQTVFYSCEH